MSADPRTPPRRRLLAGLGGLAAAALLPGCTAEPRPAPRPSAMSTTASPTPTPTFPTHSPAPTAPPTRSPTSVGPTPVAPGLPARWRPGRRDSAPQEKRLAVAALMTAGTWERGDADLSTRLAGLAVTPRAVRALAASGIAEGGEQAVAGVRVAQLGGLLPRSASVIVVVEQWRAAGADPWQRTFDVRLRRDDRWRVVDVLPARPGAPLARRKRSESARRVLAEPRLRLPAAARADVAAGSVDDRLLSLLLALAEDHVLDVTVLRSGHPYRIFDKPQVSDHSVGRAADVWAVDGRPVVDDRRRRILAVMQRAVELGAYQVGGPWDPGPQAAPYYSDAVHQDHLHLGVPDDSRSRP